MRAGPHPRARRLESLRSLAAAAGALSGDQSGVGSSPYIKKARCLRQRALGNNPGSDLLSHAVSHAVPSAVAGLTSVFGMGTGVTLLL
jgi:hypothetical protein